MPLKVARRTSTGAWTISGAVGGRRIRPRAQSNDRRLAEEEAASFEFKLLREAWHGERRGSRSFAEAALSYLEAAPRSEGTKARVRRIVVAIGKASLSEVDQDTAIRLRSTMLRPGSSPATYLREVVAPMRAILRHAVDRGWSEPTRII